MQIQKIKAIGLLSLMLMLLVLAFWWGELGAAFDIFIAIPASLVVGIAVALLTKCVAPYLASSKDQSWWQYGLMALGVATIFFTGFYGGYASYYHALNSCQADGEQVRRALQAYHQQYQTYPISLDVLDTPTPCQRYMHASLLFYRQMHSGYELTYSDWITLHRATETSDFEVHK